MGAGDPKFSKMLCIVFATRVSKTIFQYAKIMNIEICMDFPNTQKAVLLQLHYVDFG